MKVLPAKDERREENCIGRYLRGFFLFIYTILFLITGKKFLQVIFKKIRNRLFTH